MSNLIKKTFLKLKVSNENILNLNREKDVEKILRVVLKNMGNKNEAILVGLGNTKGVGQNLMDYFNKFGEIK